MPQKTVYFLGAGASAASDFKLPVMKGFFKKEDFPEEGGEYPNLKQFFATFCPNTPFKKINLEEIITHIELTMEGFNWGPVDFYLYEAKQELYKYIKYKLDNQVKEKECKKHLELFKKLNKNNDSIITLNYDLLIDNTLPKLFNASNKDDPTNDFLKRSNRILGDYRGWSERLMSQTSEEKGKGIFIKLHGSIDWFYCPSSGCPNNHVFSYYQYYVPGDPCPQCGTGIDLVIVPPTMKKSFEKFPKLGFLWHVAFNKLKEADRIIVIGMSFPDSDYYLKWLVRQAMIERATPPDLVIVNPDIKKTEFLDKYKAIFGVSPAEAHNGLDDYLTHL